MPYYKRNLSGFSSVFIKNNPRLNGGCEKMRPRENQRWRFAMTAFISAALFVLTSARDFSGLTK